MIINLPPKYRWRSYAGSRTWEACSPNTYTKRKESWKSGFSTMGLSDKMVVGGLDSVVSIINSIDRGTEKFILETLDVSDSELAEDIRKCLFVFEDIIKLSNQAIQRVLKEVETSDVTTALKGATEEVKNTILSNLSKRLQEMILDDMQVMGPVRVKDVEAAQQRIVNAVRQLEDAGEIIVSRGEGDDVIV